MKHETAIRFGTGLLIVFIVITLWASSGRMFTPVTPEKDIPTIDPALVSQAKGPESLDYLIFFEEQADLSDAYDMPWDERGWYVYETLKALADKSQHEVRAFLDQQGISYESFWVQNVIAVESSSSETLYGLLNYEEIDTVESVPQIYLDEPVLPPNDAEVMEVLSTASNLTHIKADQVWSMGIIGDGFVVGSIDTGVRYTHEALISQYRGNQSDHNYNWWDAVNGERVPYDDQGHGSHVTGIMVGANGPGTEIGVAPGSDWIACKAISQSGSGFGWDFLKCGQFMLAPMDLDGNNANPDLRPHVVNNSWGGCGQTYSNWFESTIDAWVAAGIYPVFANGNAGNCGYPSPPGLNTVGNPARSYHVTAVGSTGRDNGAYANHSNWGPTDSEDTRNPHGYPTIKPQVVAPGVNIRSAVGSGDNDYANWGGTSMSAPHVAGLVALMWESGECLTGNYVATETMIQQTSNPIPYATGNGDEGPGNVPNHATGWGEIDAQAAVIEARNYCNGGILDGTVLNTDTQDPIPGVIVEATAQGDGGIVFTAEANGSGYFSMPVHSGETYDIVMTAYGYQAITIFDVVVSLPGEVVTTDTNLTSITQTVTVSGTVSDGSGHYYPLYAYVQLVAAPHTQGVFTDPFDGTFDMIVYEGVFYDLTVTSMIEGYETIFETEVTFSGPSMDVAYALVVDQFCNAPGYQPLNNKDNNAIEITLIENETENQHSCEVLPGGVLAGFVNNSATGKPINGAEISTANTRVVSQSTPHDADLPDGFYFLFHSLDESKGDVPVTVSKDFYSKSVVEMPIIQDEITQREFLLESFIHKIVIFIENLLDFIVNIF